MLIQFMQTQQQMQTPQTSIRNLEHQFGMLANTLNNHQPRRFSSDTQVIRMEEGKECKVVELRSGKELHDPYSNQEPDIIEEKGSP